MIIDSCPVPGCGFTSPGLLPDVIRHLCEVHLSGLPDHEFVVGAAVSRAVSISEEGVANLVAIAMITQTMRDERTQDRLNPGDTEVGVAEMMMNPDSARHLGQLLIQIADVAEGIGT